MSTLKSRREEILNQIAGITNLRRGQLSEQYYKRTNKDGKVSKAGPYYVWQAWIQNEKRSRRIKKSDVEEVRRDTQNYQKLKKLFDDLAAVTEEITLRDKGATSKKKSKKPKSASPKK